MVANAASQKVQLRAQTNLEQQNLRTVCQDVDSMATLLLFTFCAGAIKAWPKQAQRFQDTTARSTACARWTPVPLLRNLSRVRCHKYLPTQPSSSIRRPTAGPSWGSDSDRQRIALAIKQKAARDEHWRLIRSACDSEDHKEFSKDPEWRKEFIQAHSSLLKACDSTRDKLEQATDIIKSMHPGRAQIDVNPTQVAIALQPAVEEGSVTQEQADTMVKIATEGISVEEFRDLLGESTDLSAGNTEEPEDEEILLDFYFAQAARSRVLLFPRHSRAERDTQDYLCCPDVTMCDWSRAEILLRNNIQAHANSRILLSPVLRVLISDD